MNISDMGTFVPELLRAAALVSLLSVWVLVGLFYYLNRFARREDFRIWTGAWLFYAMWLTLGLAATDARPGSILFTANQTCAALSAAFLVWGSFRCLEFPIPQKFTVALATFLGLWILAGPQLIKGAIQIHLPVFILLGISSPFAVASFVRLQRQKLFAGQGMLSLGFLIWVVYIGSYPFAGANETLHGAGICLAAAMQVIIAGAMVLILLEEIQRETEAVRAQLNAVRLEQSKLLSTKEACESLFSRLRAAEENANAVAEMRRDRQSGAERDHLDALGQMAGDVAHDINNALTPITAYSELLLTTLPGLTPLARQRLQRINKAAEDVAAIAAHMREFYRPPGEAEPAPAEKNPPAAPPVKQIAKSNRPAARELCRPLRILCIDDEAEVRQVLQDVLELNHHEITIATTGQEGLDLFHASMLAQEPYDVVITDLSMPDIDGRNVARAIKAESSGTPVIMLTGWGTRAEHNRETSQVVDAVLSKPPRVNELSNILLRLTAQKN